MKSYARLRADVKSNSQVSCLVKVKVKVKVKQSRYRP